MADKDWRDEQRRIFSQLFDSVFRRPSDIEASHHIDGSVEGKNHLDQNKVAFQRREK